MWLFVKLKAGLISHFFMYLMLITLIKVTFNRKQHLIEAHSIGVTLYLTSSMTGQSKKSFHHEEKNIEWADNTSHP